MFEVIVEHIKNGNCVSLTFKGTYPTTNNKIDDLYRQISDLCKKHASQKVIIDYRNVVYSPSPSQMIDNTRRIIKFDLTSIYFAVIFDYNTDSFKNYKLFLAEAETQRLVSKTEPKYKVFTDYNDALNWIISIDLS